VKWLRDDGRDFTFGANNGLLSTGGAPGDDTGSRLTFGGSAVSVAPRRSIRNRSNSRPFASRRRTTRKKE
jgi:hypothetical protein